MSEKTNDGYYEAYWPRSPRQQLKRELAPRLDTLEGKTVAQLWDFAFPRRRGVRAARRRPEEALSRRQVRELARVRQHARRRRDAKSLAALPQRFKELGVDAVISGMAC